MKKIFSILMFLAFTSVVKAGDFINVNESTFTISMPLQVNEIALDKANSTYGDLALYFLDDSGDPIESRRRGRIKRFHRD